MSSVDESAIEKFLKSGGKIVRAEERILVSESELLEYLASCGVNARYLPGDARPYLCGGKRVSMARLVAIANEHRRSAELPPFATRITMRLAGALR